MKISNILIFLTKFFIGTFFFIMFASLYNYWFLEPAHHKKEIALLALQENYKKEYIEINPEMISVIKDYDNCINKDKNERYKTFNEYIRNNPGVAPLIKLYSDINDIVKNNEKKISNQCIMSVKHEQKLIEYKNAQKEIKNKETKKNDAEYWNNVAFISLISSNK